MFLIIGDVFLDVYNLGHGVDRFIRLGGIFHAARAFSAIGAPFSIACIAPDFLKSSIYQEAEELGSVSTYIFGSVSGAPNIIWTENPSEYSEQGYDYLLRELYSADVSIDVLRNIVETSRADNILIMPGRYPVNKVLDSLENQAAQVHIDIHYDVGDLETLDSLGRRFNTVFCSTSSNLFRKTLGGSFPALCKALIPDLSEQVILKENRGGVRWSSDSKALETLSAPAHPRPVVHSVGIGDCFDAVYLANVRDERSISQSLAYASYIAAEYGATWAEDQFSERAKYALKISPDDISQLLGVCVPWEIRETINIYIAAPDFEHVDTSPLDDLVQGLRYHNYSPRLPIREHGIVAADDSPSKKNRIFNADMALLNECDMVVAVLLYDDPGTLIEIGLAASMGKPVVVYDPRDIARNLVLLKTPKSVSRDCTSVIDSVFQIASSIIADRGVQC